MEKEIEEDFKDKNRALKRAAMRELEKMIEGSSTLGLIMGRKEEEFPGQNAIVWSFVILGLGMFVAMLLELGVLLPWLFFFSGLSGVCGSFQVIKHGIIIYGWLGFVERGWVARLMGWGLFIMYLLFSAFGGFLVYKQVSFDLIPSLLGT